MSISQEFATASNGTLINLTGAMTMSYTGDVLDYIEIVQNGVTYRQTFTYTGNNLTAVSAWVAQ